MNGYRSHKILVCIQWEPSIDLNTFRGWVGLDCRVDKESNSSGQRHDKQDTQHAGTGH